MYIKWNLTKKCSLKCKFCHNVNNRKEWNLDLSQSDILSTINNLNNSKKVTGMTLLGGEPTEANNFLDVCDALQDTNIKFGFITSGESLTEKKFNDVINNKNLKFIGFSIDSFNNEKVEFIRGRNILNNQLNSLKLIINEKKKKNLNYEIFINTILMSINIDEIIDMITYFYNIGVNKVQILGYNTRDAKSNELSLSIKQEFEFIDMLMPFIKKNIDMWNKNNFKLQLNFIPPIANMYIKEKYGVNIETGVGFTCPIYRDTAFLSNDGNVYPCDNYKPYIEVDEDDIPIKTYTIDNLRYKSFENILNNEYFNYIDKLKSNKDKLYKNCEPCNTCPELFKTCTPCIVYGVNNSLVEYEKCSYYRDRFIKKGELIYGKA